MTALFRFSRTALFSLTFALVATGALVHLRLGAATEKPQILFLRLTDGYWQLWIADGDGDRPRQLTKSPVDKHSPNWCPGNEVVSFSTVHGINVLLELATGEEHPQLRLPSAVESPKDLDGRPLPFDVDVRKLLVERGFDRFAGLTCGVDGPPSEVIEVWSPSVFREGAAIVFHRRYTPEFKPVYEVDAAELADGAVVEASRSTDGRVTARRVLSEYGTLTFVSDRSGGTEIWSMRPSTAPKRLTDLAASVGRPFWSHDGRFIYFESDFEGRRQINRVKADGDVIQRISDGVAPSRNAVLSWSPDEGKSQ